MCVISEIYNGGHNILELADIYQLFLSEQVKRKVIITNIHDDKKYDMTNELLNYVRLKKATKLHRIIA